MRHEPFKTFYLLFQLLTTLNLRAPILTLYYLPRANRPRESWSLSRAVAVRIIDYFLNYVTSRCVLLTLVLGGAFR